LAHSLGVSTNRDAVVYDFGARTLEVRIHATIEAYNAEVDRFKRAGSGTEVDHFVRYDIVKWSESLKFHLKRGTYAKFSGKSIRRSVWRPFCKRWLYFDRTFVDRVRAFPSLLPNPESEAENRFICVPGLGNRKGFGCLIADAIVSLDLAFEKVQCFPFYTYNEDGTNRREKHHRLGPRPNSAPTTTTKNHQVEHLPLRLRPPPPSRLPRKNSPTISNANFPASPSPPIPRLRQGRQKNSLISTSITKN